MKHELILYTQPNCVYCDMMKSKLDEWGYKQEVIDIQKYESAKLYILEQGHKTVPQLYYGSTNVNRNVNTEEFTQCMLEQYIGHLDEVK